jgi:hypothetical protein
MTAGPSKGPSKGKAAAAQAPVDDVARPALFETWVVAELAKQSRRLAKRPRLAQPPLPEQRIHRLARALLRHAATASRRSRSAVLSGVPPFSTLASRTSSLHQGSRATPP